MKIRKAAIGASVALLATLSLAACGEAPDESSNDDGASAETTNDFLPCIVSDQGGFDDASFNEEGFNGLTRAAEELGSDYIDVESTTDADYGPNLENLVAEGCDAIVSVGFSLEAATLEAAEANPDIDWIIIDENADLDEDGTKDSDVVKGLQYNTAQAAFLAGYAAADFSKTGVVGTYGGAPIDTVTVFMEGFAQGVEYYNEQKDAEVEVVGLDLFTGGFAAGPEATNAARQVLGEGADVILPVGGPIYEGALTAIEDSGDDVVMIGVDADLYESDPRTQDVVFTSILKGMQTSTYEAVLAAGNGEFDAENYIGTLENDGVGIASFHNFEDEVSDTLEGELDEIRAGIIDGSIEVDSYLNQS